MSNFDLHEKAQQLADTKSGYELARLLIQEQEISEDLRNRIVDIRYDQAEQGEGHE